MMVAQICTEPLLIWVKCHPFFSLQKYSMVDINHSQLRTVTLGGSPISLSYIRCVKRYKFCQHYFDTFILDSVGAGWPFANQFIDENFLSIEYTTNSLNQMRILKTVVGTHSTKTRSILQLGRNVGTLNLMYGTYFIK